MGKLFSQFPENVVFFCQYWILLSQAINMRLTITKDYFLDFLHTKVRKKHYLPLKKNEVISIFYSSKSSYMNFLMIRIPKMISVIFVTKKLVRWNNSYLKYAVAASKTTKCFFHDSLSFKFNPFCWLYLAPNKWLFPTVHKCLLMEQKMNPKMTVVQRTSAILE